MIRYQPPSYSPLCRETLPAAVSAWLRAPDQGLMSLREHLTHRFECANVVLTGSGTQALELALRMSRSSASSSMPVAFPAYSCFDLATAALGAQVPLRFYDLDPVTLLPEGNSFRRVLREGVGAAVVGNLFGYPLDWDAVAEECWEAGVTLIEDAAQGVGTFWQDRKGGSFGDLTILSFGRGKGWTGAGGGALLIRSPDFAERGPALDLQAQSLLGDVRKAASALGQWIFSRPELFWVPKATPWLGLGETHFRDPSPLAEISRFSAALVGMTSELALEEIRYRRERGRLLLNLLTDGGAEAPPGRPCLPVEGGAASFLRLPYLLPTRPVKIPRSLERLGVAPGYPSVLPHLPQIRHLVENPKDPMPGADRLSKSLVTLPTHSRLTDRELRSIPDLLRVFS